MSQQPIIEERHVVNEDCYWNIIGTEKVSKGTILDESASGLLLQPNQKIETGQRLQILCTSALHSTTSSITPTYLLQNPLTRVGTVVRIDEKNCVGVQFDKKNKNSEFQRWYRGKCTITALMFSDRCILHVEGNMQIEAAAQLQTIINSQKKVVNDIFISICDLDDIAIAASALLRSTVEKCDAEGIIITLIGGKKDSKNYKALQNILLKNGVVFTKSDCYELPVLENIQTNSEHSKTPEKHKKNNSKTGSIVIFSTEQTALNRLSLPLKKNSVEIRTTNAIAEAIDFVVNNPPPFIIADIEIETAHQLLELNKLQKYELRHTPPLLLIGPNHIYPLLEAALFLPIGIYLTKPLTERDYGNALSKMLDHAGISILDNQPTGTG